MTLETLEDYVNAFNAAKHGVGAGGPDALMRQLAASQIPTEDIQARLDAAREVEDRCIISRNAAALLQGVVTMRG